MTQFLRHESCPKCGSKDNLARYSDGHAYCFSSGCNYYESGDGEVKAKQETQPMPGLIEFESTPLNKRNLDEKTCKMWDSGVGQPNGRPVQVANYRNKSGDIVAQKLRFPDKTFRWVGDHKSITLYGQHLCRDSGKMVIIVEGEIDALSVSRVFNNKATCVSIPDGAKSATKYVAQNLQWLEKFEEVVFCFDQDDQGREAAKAAAQIMSPGKAKIVTAMPCKDANDCLVEGKVKELIDSIYGAKVYRPDGVIPGEELWDIVNKKDTRKSIPYPWQGLNEKLHGMRGGELVVLTAGTGIGKSSIAREWAHYLLDMGQKVGYVALEESVRRTAEHIIGIEMNCPIHYWKRDNITDEQKKEAFDKTVGSGRMVVYDHWGSIDPANLISQIRYMARAMGCRYIILDHLSIVVSALEAGDERRMIDNTMTKLRSLVEETGIHLVVVSHLRRPEGRSHEEGGNTSLSQLRGSHAIAQLSDAVVGCERNQQDDVQANILSLRVLKNRFSGDCGIATTLEYVKDSGRLNEWVAPDLTEVPQ